MKKPDRFERMVRKQAFCTPGSKVTYYLDPFDAITLLRKEHRWMVRMVKKVDAWQAGQLADDSDAIGVILDQLKKRAR